jgi:guanosine-3',5'-bis(diphosphate) 3'-pyrophosphohydrolase
MEQSEIQKIIDKYKSYGVTLDEEMVGKAIQFAIKYHGSQHRESGAPYYEHPLAVAEIVAQMKFDSASIVTAILHDTIEDTELTYEDIEQQFSPDIAKLVDGVTKLTKIELKSYDVRQAENFRKLLMAISSDIRVLVVKLADRLHNMRTIDFVSKQEKKERISLETLEIYAPLAERIGMQKIKVELQDIAFKILYPDVRDSIILRLGNVFGNTEDIIGKIIKELTNAIQPIVANVRIYGRKKTPYSVWMKMTNKNVTIDQLSDVIAFRVIVPSVADCYTILGIIHSKYKMVPNCFQDFISIPKNNGYQSIHTVVMGPLGCKIEVQIRTQEMHEIAEWGVAAHWRYKQNHHELVDGQGYDIWIRELLSILNNNTAAEERLQNTKLAMYYDQVFCFTPLGKVISLPKGATVIDFAYMVHTDIGNTCVGAKVNGAPMPLDTELINGDQVEIITSRNHVASPLWEKFAITGKAKAEIRKATELQQNDEYVKLGYNILSKALKVASIHDEEDAIKKACEFFHKSRSQLLASVGRGLISREEVVRYVSAPKSRLNKTLEMFVPNRRKKIQSLIDQHKVPIQGLISGIAMHFAECCQPINGDKIVGVIDVSNGITIHIKNCPILAQLSLDRDRIIELTWDSSNANNAPFIGCLEVVMKNEPSSLSLVTAEIARVQGNITNFNLVKREKDLFVIRFYIDVSSVSHFEQIINALRIQSVVKNVYKIKT